MNAKLHLFPQGTSIDPDGHLTFRGQEAFGLARLFGTPLYIYDVGTIRYNIELYRENLSKYAGPTQLTYASKAFLCSALAQLMTEEGVGLDVSSMGEIHIAQRAGTPPAEMHLHGNNKTRRDLEAALQAGVGRIVVDNRPELDRLAQLAAIVPQPINIWLRVTPDILVKTHHRFTVTGTANSKFGFPIDQIEAIAGQILTNPTYHNLRLTGLHVHLGSHFHEAGPVAAALDRLLVVANSLRETHGWQMAELCPGGGWGVPYHPTDPLMPVTPFVAGLIAAVEKGCAAYRLPLPTLILEPGRSLVAQAGVALYTVGSRKEIPGVRTFVSVDGGLADNPRPALYQARYTAVLANRAIEPETETVAVAGSYCESGDILIDEVELPPARPDDVLAIPVAGAYQLSMSSNYNAALRPAVVFVEGHGAKLVQRRETVADLVRRDVGEF